MLRRLVVELSVGDRVRAGVCADRRLEECGMGGGGTRDDAVSLGERDSFGDQPPSPSRRR
jgi:hypothetical protein